MGLDPRVAQQSGRNIQVLSHILLQRSRQQSEQEQKDKDIEIRALTQIVNNPQASDERRAAASKQIDQRLGFTLPGTTVEGLAGRKKEAMISELMGGVFGDPKFDPKSRTEAQQVLEGERPFEGFTPRQTPEDVADIDLTGEKQITEQTKQAVNRMREKVLEKSLLENKKGNKQKSASDLLALMRLDQKIISDWQDSFASLAGEEKPEEVEAAESRLKFYTTIGESVIGEQFKKQIDVLKKSQQKAQTKKVPGFNIRVPDFSNKSTDELIKEFSEK